MEVRDDSYKVYGTYGRMSYNREYQYYEGEVETKFGTVTVYHEPNREITRLWFNFGGRIYHRHIEGKVYQERGISRAASAFAREVDAGKCD